MKRNAGFTLFEMMLTTGVVFAIVGILMGFSIVTQRSSAAYAMVGEVQMLTDAVSKMYGPNAKTSGAPYAAISTTAIAPYMGRYSVTSPSVAISTPFGTTITLASASLYGTSGDSYSIAFLVPVNNCAEIITTLQQSVQAISVGATGNVTAVQTAGGGLATPAAITTACQHLIVAGSGPANTTIWLYTIG